MLRSRASLAAVLWIATAAFGQSATPSPDTLSVGGEGRFESAPDTALLQFTISAQDSRMKAAYDKAAQSAEQLRQTLRTNGIDPRAAEIGSFAITPVYDWNNGKRKLTGYRVSSRVSVKVREFDKLGPLVETFSDLDSNNSLNLSYMIENTEAAKARAIEDAYRRARRQAEVLCQASGRGLGEMSYAALDSSEISPPPPRPLMMAKARATAPSPIDEFTPDKITVTAHVNVLFRLK